MIQKKEKQILQFIKYAPVIATILVSTLITYFITLDNNENFEREINNLKSEYLAKNKQLIHQEVDRVYNYIKYKKQKSEEKLKENLKQRVYEAYAIANSIYQNNKDKSDKEILALIKIALNEIRFNDGRGYFFIINNDGYNIFHPIKSLNLEGKYIWDVQDINGKYITREIVGIAKTKGEGYSEFHWYRNDKSKKQYRKIGFYKAFKPLNMIINTAEFLDDYEDELKIEILNYINSIKYTDNGYIFIIDYQGTTLSHINKNLRGLKFEDIKKKKHKELISEFINIGKNKKSGYHKYIGEYNKSRKITADKISFIKSFDSWQWIIGTGFYQDELLKEIRKKEEALVKENEHKILDVLFLATFTTTLLLAISIFVSRRLESKFNEYKEQNNILTQQTKMASMGEMIGNIAHQWRQPLNMISMAVSTLKFNKEFGLQDDKKEEEAFELILKSTNHLSQTIDDFRNYFNPNKKEAYFNTKNMYEKILTFTSAKFKNKEIEIIKDIDEVDIQSYENELIQSIFNIMNNAYDAFEENDIKDRYLFVSIKHLEECKFQKCTTPCKQKELGECIEIIIKDTAGGIPKDVLPKIFEAYFTTKHQSQGTGIGLYMTYNIIVKNLKGTIKVNNTTYKYNDKEYTGAEFKITLPLTIK